jgi:hypothetical protein
MEEYKQVIEIIKLLKNAEKRSEMIMVAIKEEDIETFEFLSNGNRKENIELIIQHGSLKFLTELSIVEKNQKSIIASIFKFDRVDFFNVLLNNNEKFMGAVNCDSFSFNIGKYNSRKILSTLMNTKKVEINYTQLVAGLLESNLEDEILVYLSNPEIKLDQWIFEMEIKSFRVFLKIIEASEMELRDLERLKYIAIYQYHNIEIVAWLLSRISVTDFLDAVHYFVSISKYPRIISLLIQNARIQDFANIHLFLQSVTIFCESCKKLPTFCYCPGKNVSIHIFRQLVDEKIGSKMHEIFSTNEKTEMLQLFKTTKSFYDTLKEEIVGQVSCKYLADIILSHL